MHVWVGASHIIAEWDSKRGWGRERVSTQHEFWPAVVGKGAKLVHSAAMNVCAQGGFLLCLEACAVPRHIFHLHTLNSLGGARGSLAWAHWTFLFFFLNGGWVLARLCERAACLLARRRFGFRIFFLFLDAQNSPQCLFSVRTNHIVSLSCSLFGSNRTTVHGLQQFGDYTDPRNLTVKGENGKPRRPFHILSVGGREAGPPDLSLV